jgi:hypothetical protein
VTQVSLQDINDPGDQGRSIAMRIWAAPRLTGVDHDRGSWVWLGDKQAR